MNYKKLLDLTWRESAMPFSKDSLVCNISFNEKDFLLYLSPFKNIVIFFIEYNGVCIYYDDSLELFSYHSQILDIMSTRGKSYLLSLIKKDLQDDKHQEERKMILDYLSEEK